MGTLGSHPEEPSLEIKGQKSSFLLSGRELNVYNTTRLPNSPPAKT